MSDSSSATRPSGGARFVSLLGGLALVGAAFAIDPVLGNAPVWGPAQTAGVVLGILIAVLGFAPLGPGLRKASTGLAFFVLSGVVTLAAAEGIGRALEIDFAKEEDTFLAIPPCFRQPTKSSGAALFRRPGPQKWTGQVLSTRLQQLAVSPNPYEDEPVITVTYDEDGFRNPEDLEDWGIAVVGDSFTELGYLAQEQLFTSILGEELGIPTKNLGISMTGPFTQLHYLEDFGQAPSLRDVVMVFYEGNDHHDVISETRWFERLEEEGERSHRSFTKQSSLLKAIVDRIRGPEPSPRGTNVTSGYFKGADGPVPISIYRVPPGREEMRPGSREGIEKALKQYASTCKENGWKPWLVYMPAKTRVLFGMVEFTDIASDEVKVWTPSDYPDFVREICEREGLEFIDVTPVLRKVTQEEGVLVYNSIWDEHLNARGSALVGEELVRRMGPVIAARN